MLKWEEFRRCSSRRDAKLTPPQAEELVGGAEREGDPALLVDDARCAGDRLPIRCAKGRGCFKQKVRSRGGPREGNIVSSPLDVQRMGNVPEGNPSRCRATGSRKTATSEQFGSS